MIIITFISEQEHNLASIASEIGRYEVPREEDFPGLGLGMVIDDFQIAGIPHDVTWYCLSYIYVDDTQLYISFKCNNPLASLPKLNNCISDIRGWMIKKKKLMTLKLNLMF